MTAFDYPSQRFKRHFPAEPMLLDTCVLQHLEYVGGLTDHEYDLSDNAAESLLVEHGPTLGPELVALADLFIVLGRSDAPPWAVSEVSLIEFEKLDNEKGSGLRAWWREWADYFAGCVLSGWYPHIDAERLVVRSIPAVSEGQLSLPIVPPQWPLAAECIPPLAPFRDAGDRALIRTAMRAGIPAILTTDLNSFWRHRRAAYALGVEIWRPTDLFQTLRKQAA
jgi:hypothetical protein